MTTAPVVFTTVLQQRGKTATGISVPEADVLALGAGRRVAVVVTINGGYSYRSTLTPYAGEYLIPVSSANRDAAGIAGGDTIEVSLDVDTAPRTVEVPDDLATALTADAEAAAFFATLSYSNQNAYVAWLATAKQAATRSNRVAQAVAALHEHRTR